MDKVLPDWLNPSGPTRFRLAIVLLAMCCAIIAGKLIEDALLERLRNDCSSLFDDRLVPATTLFHLADQMHARRHLLESHVREGSGVDRGALDDQLARHDERVSMLTEQFAETYLVAEEFEEFARLRAALANYLQVEQRLLAGMPEEDDARATERLDRAFDAVRERLLALTAVQQEVGAQLRDESAVSVSSMTSLLYLQLGIAFVLGLIASALAMSLARTPKQEPSGPTNRFLH